MNASDLERITIIIDNPSIGLGEKLFAISDLFSNLFWNNLDNRSPSEFEKTEATIFACVWTLKILAAKYPASFDECQSACIRGIAEKASFKVLQKMMEIEEIEGKNFFSIRFKFYVSETNNMADEGYQYGALLDKLYLNPLSSLTVGTLRDFDMIEYLNLCSIFTTGLKFYDKGITDILRLMEAD